MDPMEGIEGPTESLLSMRSISASGSNLLLLLGMTIFLVWGVRLMRLVNKIYELNISIKAGNVVRLNGQDESFGEMEMLWRSNMQQQLLRARRVFPAITVEKLQVPFDISKGSIKVVEDTQNGLLGVTFNYKSTARLAVQMFWNVQGTAFQQTLGRFNHDHLGSGGRVSTHGRRKKRLFGQRYMSVNDREISVGNGGGNDTRTSGADSCGGRKQGPLFSDTECKCRSAVTMLDAGEGEFVAPDQSLVPFSFANIVEGFGGEASQAEDGKEEAPAAEPQGETAAAEAADLAAARAQVLLLIIAVKVMETCQAGSDNSQKEGEKVSLMMFVVEMGRDQSLGLTKRVVVSSRAAYVTKELYGEHDETTQEECVICLSDPKDTALLPCRHLCVCSSCFSRLELCPVCRAPFTAYLRIPTKSEDQDEGEEVLLEGGITGRRSASGTVAIDLENAGSGQDRQGMEAEEGPVTVRATAYGGGESA